MTKESTTEQLNLCLLLLEETKDAYSFNRYGAAEWYAICKHLLNYQGFNFDEAKMFLYSKNLRHAADFSGEETLRALTRYEGEHFQKVA